VTEPNKTELKTIYEEIVAAYEENISIASDAAYLMVFKILLKFPKKLFLILSWQRFFVDKRHTEVKKFFNASHLIRSALCHLFANDDNLRQTSVHVSFKYVFKINLFFVFERKGVKFELKERSNFLNLEQIDNMCLT
jgi:hypothetical protein